METARTPPSGTLSKLAPIHGSSKSHADQDLPVEGGLFGTGIGVHTPRVQALLVAYTVELGQLAPEGSAGQLYRSYLEARRPLRVNFEFLHPPTDSGADAKEIRQNAAWALEPHPSGRPSLQGTRVRGQKPPRKSHQPLGI
jgi:hypothetical protein